MRPSSASEERLASRSSTRRSTTSSSRTTAGFGSRTTRRRCRGRRRGMKEDEQKGWREECRSRLSRPPEREDGYSRPLCAYAARVDQRRDSKGCFLVPLFRAVRFAPLLHPLDFARSSASLVLYPVARRCRRVCQSHQQKSQKSKGEFSRPPWFALTTIDFDFPPSVRSFVPSSRDALPNRSPCSPGCVH